VRDLEVLDADEDDADAQFELALNDVVSPREAGDLDAHLCDQVDAGDRVVR